LKNAKTRKRSSINSIFYVYGLAVVWKEEKYAVFGADPWDPP
jgi:hypothetical protein